MPSISNAQARLNAAAALAWASSRRGKGGPFGAVIIKNGHVIATGWNTVLASHDPTSHAEVNAIRKAGRSLGTHDLSGCEIYSTTEPCPMCFAAIHWAKIGAATYSTTIGDVARLGFNELSIPNTVMKRLGHSPVKIRRVANTACRDLLTRWAALPKRRTY